MANEEAWRAVGFTEDAVQEITELVRLDKLKAAQALVQSSWDDVNRRAVHTVEQSQAMDALAEQLREAGEAVAQHDITLRDDGVFVVRDRQGRVVDTAGTPEAAFELARAVAEREQVIEREREEAARADYEAWYEAELARRDAEVAGFEMEHERVEEAQADAQSRGEVGMPEAGASNALAEATVDPEVAAKIQEVIDAAKQEGNPHKRVTIGRVSGWVVDALKDLLGIDASGYSHMIDEDAVRHIFREHGNEKVEKSRGQVAITEDDLLALPVVINSPDKVSLSEGRKGGEQSVIYEKKMPDGTVIYVETVSNRRNRLLAKTMYKKAPFSPVDASSNNRTRQPNVRNEEAWGQRNPSQQARNVNSDVFGSPLRQNQPNAARVSYEGEAAQAGSALAKRKKPVSAWEVMGAIAKVAEAVGRSPKGMNRVGKVAKRTWLGHFEGHSKVTRIKVANDIWAAAHELAHAIDDAIWPRGHWLTNDLGLPKAQREELRKLGKQLYGKREPHNGYHSEGFAEFTRLWLTDTAQAKQKAPEFAKWFERQLEARPELAKAIAHAQALAHRYLAQGAKQRADANLGRKEGELAQAWEWLKENLFYQIEEKVFDSGAAVRRLAHTAAKARGERQLAAELDPMLTLVGSRMTAAGVVDYMANHGMLDFGRNRTGGLPLAQAFALVGKDKVRDFEIYLWAKRSVALWDDPRGPRNPGMDRADAEHLVSELESPEFIRAAQIVYEWSAGVLNYAAQASPALAETVRKIREVDPGYYIPLQREFADLDARYGGRGTGGGAARAQVTKRLKGSGRGVKDITESMMAQAHNMILKAHQRRVIDQVMHLSRTTEGLGHLVVEVPVDQVPVAHASLAELLAKVESAVGTNGALRAALKEVGNADLLSEMTTFFAPANNPKKGDLHVFAVWEGGRTRWYEVDERLYTALSGIDSPQMGPLMKLFALPAKAVRLGTTGLRPSFSLVTNAVRDFSTLYLNSRADALQIDDYRFISHPRLMPYEPSCRALVLAYLNPEPAHTLTSSPS